jgi:Family of unknown function (DUF6496)
MPEEETIERAREDEREGKSPSTQAGEFVREEMEHIREGEHGARSPEQAIAIGLSKARRAGVKLPPPKRGKQRTKHRQNAISQRAAPGAAKSLLGNAPARRNARLNARVVAPHQGRHCRDTRSGWPGNALHVRARPPRRKQRARGSAGAEM